MQIDKGCGYFSVAGYLWMQIRSISIFWKNVLFSDDTLCWFRHKIKTHNNNQRQKNNPNISFIILVSPKFLWVFQTGFLLPIVRTKYISFYLQVAVIFLFFLLFKKQYFVLKIVLTYCVKKCSCDGEKLLRIQGWRPRICKIHSNSEMSDQLLTQNIFSTYSWRLLHSNNYDANLNK